ncbi:hypothetical protein IMCC3317_13460 [Kordia antarctica]|uniref:Uncharacterized protein n=1 Tax=Kordia antarctica TaxID=1218801 RepID=A0A7L4ZHC1_9FLAO|nr:hypothetical protein [Kordia antarctica]QHI35995.1 hypothetical protein IMCC3317_13460 [Kordia antarctica]
MLKNILKLEGTQKLNKTAQKEILGGRRNVAECTNASHCPANHICQNGRCFDCYDPFSGSWYC